MSLKKRTERAAEFKKKVAIEAIKERKTINEIAALFEIHPRLVSKWKKEFLDNAQSIFEFKNNNQKLIKEQRYKEAKLHEKIGQLTIELDWLKKKIGIEQ